MTSSPQHFVSEVETYIDGDEPLYNFASVQLNLKESLTNIAGEIVVPAGVWVLGIHSSVISLSPQKKCGDVYEVDNDATPYSVTTPESLADFLTSEEFQNFKVCEVKIAYDGICIHHKNRIFVCNQKWTPLQPNTETTNCSLTSLQSSIDYEDGVLGAYANDPFQKPSQPPEKVSPMQIDQTAPRPRVEKKPIVIFDASFGSAPALVRLGIRMDFVLMEENKVDFLEADTCYRCTMTEDTITFQKLVSIEPYVSLDEPPKQFFNLAARTTGVMDRSMFYAPTSDLLSWSVADSYALDGSTLLFFKGENLTLALDLANVPRWNENTFNQTKNEPIENPKETEKENTMKESNVDQKQSFISAQLGEMHAKQRREMEEQMRRTQQSWAGSMGVPPQLFNNPSAPAMWGAPGSQPDPRAYNPMGVQTPFPPVINPVPQPGMGMPGWGMPPAGSAWSPMPGCLPPGGHPMRNTPFSPMPAMIPPQQGWQPQPSAQTGQQCPPWVAPLVAPPAVSPILNPPNTWNTTTQMVIFNGERQLNSAMNPWVLNEGGGPVFITVVSGKDETQVLFSTQDQQTGAGVSRLECLVPLAEKDIKVCLVTLRNKNVHVYCIGNEGAVVEANVGRVYFSEVEMLRKRVAQLEKQSGK